MVLILTNMTCETKKTTSRCFFISMWAAHLTLLPFLSEDVTDQSLLKNFLFDQEVPKTSSWKGLMVLCPEKDIGTKIIRLHISVSTKGSHVIQYDTVYTTCNVSLSVIDMKR